MSAGPISPSPRDLGLSGEESWDSHHIISQDRRTWEAEHLPPRQPIIMAPLRELDLPPLPPPTVHCARCDTTGKDTCPVCMGGFYNPYSRRPPCQRCAGMGEITCTRCQGTGRILKAEEER